MAEVAVENGALPIEDRTIEQATIRAVARRLMWFVMALYFLAILDRGNISFAALSMNKDLGLNAQMFGISVGIMYATYALFEIPSNLILGRYGARVTLTRIAILWGVATVLMAFTQGPLSLYAFRGFLGVAESGLFPGVMLLLSLWFPFSYRARYNAVFNYSVPISYIFASLISGAILELDGTFGLPGWKWLFILEGLPPIVLGIIGIYYLTDRPQQASWLTSEQKTWLSGVLDRDARAKGVVHGRRPAEGADTPDGAAVRPVQFRPVLRARVAVSLAAANHQDVRPAGVAGRSGDRNSADRGPRRDDRAVPAFRSHRRAFLLYRGHHAAGGLRVCHRGLCGDAGLDRVWLHGRECRDLRHPGDLLDHSAILSVAAERAGRHRADRDDRQHRRRRRSCRDRTDPQFLRWLHRRVSRGFGDSGRRRDAGACRPLEAGTRPPV